ncbi:sugar transferase [Amycolatopsis sp. K13G38]|uniref:Sugar transferase n=1 Tax=Amycolatopsis acididurans TaxID=2724524 RepID=A0ABX1J3F4_9PSEU|nr:sugar transferase [Amycolatopsis acididurans]NKQ52816.1 sugar transferase [Amycolatopsis acididurans]
MEEPVRKQFPDGDALLGIDLRRVPGQPQRPLHAVGPDGTTPPRASSTAWEGRYRAWVIGADVFAVLLVIGAAALLILRVTGRPYFLHASGTALAVLCALPFNRAWSQEVLGEGAEEFRRLGRGLAHAAVVVALAGLVFGALDVQPWVFGAVPLIGLIALPQRYALRQVLHRFRNNNGTCMLPVMAAGAPGTVRELIERTRADAHVGWRVEAVCTAEGQGEAGTGAVGGIAVAGRLEEVADQVRRGGYRVVAVTADPYWTPRRLQQLAWDLEGTGAELVVAPVLMEIAGPRLNVSGVLGMPLLRVSAPAFTGGRRILKEIFDRTCAALGLLLISPVLLTIALAVKLGDRGPVFYRQRRVGRDGRSFMMIKFRTMVVNADRVRGELLGANEGAGPLFKMRRDPRVTKVGMILRRYSLDELPQLFNVLGGTMSLVGPRPPLPEETEAYEPAVRRRLLVKPGITGLWQVSGRSDLTWEESVRLDLRYVEDWSLALDMVILWKTARAVVGGRGAY